MDWSFFDFFEILFNDVSQFVAFLGEFFQALPSFVSVVLSFIVIIVVLVGGLKLAFKLIG